MEDRRERQWPHRRFSRRTFLKGSAGTAAGLAGIGLFAANWSPAAGAGDALPFQLARPDHPVTLPIFDANPPIASGLEPEHGATLQVYNWADYLYQHIVKRFAKEHDCEVVVSTFNSVDEAIAKLRTGAVDFDVYFPDPTQMGKLVASKLMQPLNHSYLPNLPNVWPSLQNPFYDLGARYSVPYTIYTTGIGWRNDKVSEDIGAMANPYEILWDPKYKGKVHIFDDYREAIGMTLLKHGITDVNTTSTGDIQAAVDDLVKLIDVVNVKTDVSDYTDLPEGSAWIHQSWSGDLVSAQYYLPKGVPVDVLSYWFPPDGRGVYGNDLIAIPRSAKNPVLAHMFLNFLLDSEIAYSNFVNFTGYQPPQSDINPKRLVSDEAVPANLASAVVLPKDVKNGYEFMELAPSVDTLWHIGWQQFTSGV